MTEHIASRYVTFADHEARGVSPLYESLARIVAQTAELLELLRSLPRHKQQPNLLFAAYRWVCGTPESPEAFRNQLLERWAEIEPVMLARSTQTNEPARCATLLPVLSRLPQPLALLEVGASAGLCLYPDRYA